VKAAASADFAAFVADAASGAVAVVVVASAALHLAPRLELVHFALHPKEESSFVRTCKSCELQYDRTECEWMAATRDALAAGVCEGAWGWACT
jgi:hypothetical protein